MTRLSSALVCRTLVLVLLATLASCAGGDGLAGKTFSCTAPNQNTTLRISFKPGGKVDAVTTEPGTITHTRSGTYEVAGDKVTATIEGEAVTLTRNADGTLAGSDQGTCKQIQ